ncbi:MAG: hypothetical protein J2P18_09335 [Nocardia sp.]|nr:hypothetical protein [Nocardia sp.]
MGAHTIGAARMNGRPDVVPWVRHLSADEIHEFTVEFIAVLSNAAELDADFAVRETLAGWRATARIKADPASYSEGTTATDGDFGPVLLDLPALIEAHPQHLIGSIALVETSGPSAQWCGPRSAEI